MLNGCYKAALSYASIWFLLSPILYLLFWTGTLLQDKTLQYNAKHVTHPVLNAMLHLMRAGDIPYSDFSLRATRYDSPWWLRIIISNRQSCHLYKIERQKDRKTKRWKDKKMKWQRWKDRDEKIERWKDRKTKRWKDKKMERQKDEKTKRWNDRKIKRLKDEKIDRWESRKKKR